MGTETSVYRRLFTQGFWVLCLFSLNTLAAEEALNAGVYATTGGQQWPGYNNRLDGQRFSPLAQITPDNADQVGEICRIQIDGATAFTAGLVQIDGVIYTNTGRQTVAIDATNCDLIWRHTYVPDDMELRQSSRGLAVLDGRVFRGTGDGRLIALDANTGEMLWKNVIGTPSLSEFASAAPLAWQGMVFMGIGGGDAGIRGRVMAYDAANGRELWRFNTIPMGNEIGADTWERPDSALTGGGGIWGAMSLDPGSAELFVPVGNPWPDIDASYRPGDNLFSNSIVVLDALTGELHWWHQAVAGDSKDFDLAAAPVLYRNANIRDVMVFGGKDGFVTAVDRDSLRIVFKTAVTQMENQDMPVTEDGLYVCPGFGGGLGWNGPALDRVTNNLLVGTRGGGCMTLYKTRTIYTPPAVTYGGSVQPDLEQENWGTVTALDAESGDIQWVSRTVDAVIAGITPTAGGIAFTGDQAGNFLILNSRTGDILFSRDIGGAMAGGVITYEIEGEQLVALATGNVSRLATVVKGLPSVVIMGLNPENSEQNPAEVALANTQISSTDAISIPNGRRLFESVCATCHGPDGNTLQDHALGSLAQRMDLIEITDYIKAPKLPMPTMYPFVISDQDVLDVSSFILENISD